VNLKTLVVSKFSILKIKFSILSIRNRKA
jgi:hypothetical protein